MLGRKFDPWQITQDPNDPNFQMETLCLPVGLTADRLGDRRPCSQEIDAQHAGSTAWRRATNSRECRTRRSSLLTAGRVKQAFALDREDPRLRDRYGRHLFGQSLLLARRLIQAGVPIVQANMGRMNNWDTHNDNCHATQDPGSSHRSTRRVSTLLDDMGTLGLLDETLVVMVGEFGRTPKLRQRRGAESPVTGRDHWAGVFSALFAGAGVRGGQVIGRSDKIAAYPATRGYYPSDLGATIYRTLGVDPASMVYDQLRRPLQLNRGEMIAPLFTGGVA